MDYAADFAGLLLATWAALAVLAACAAAIARLWRLLAVRSWPISCPVVCELITASVQSISVNRDGAVMVMIATI